MFCGPSTVDDRLINYEVMQMENGKLASLILHKKKDF